MTIIKLTHKDLANNNNTIYINTKDIITFQDTPEGTYMRLSHNNNILLNETSEEILHNLKFKTDKINKEI